MVWTKGRSGTRASHEQAAEASRGLNAILAIGRSQTLFGENKRRTVGSQIGASRNYPYTHCWARHLRDKIRYGVRRNERGSLLAVPSPPEQPIPLSRAGTVPSRSFAAVAQRATCRICLGCGPSFKQLEALSRQREFRPLCWRFLRGRTCNRILTTWTLS